jgi:hypothetical protein
MSTEGTIRGSLLLVELTLAACRSADLGGAPVRL